uniref:(northern house mosquito) hypothetical protein n=1 Tax=Culex pipiens TaxID=7175 RepID=A0A8D8CN57_CULPI
MHLNVTCVFVFMLVVFVLFCKCVFGVSQVCQRVCVFLCSCVLFAPIFTLFSVQPIPFLSLSSVLSQCFAQCLAVVVFVCLTFAHRDFLFPVFVFGCVLFLPL